MVAKPKKNGYRIIDNIKDREDIPTRTFKIWFDYYVNKTPTKELAAMYEVSEKTIYRQLERMEMLSGVSRDIIQEKMITLIPDAVAAVARGLKRDDPSIINALLSGTGIYVKREKSEVVDKTPLDNDPKASMEEAIKKYTERQGNRIEGFLNSGNKD